jgi:hypothetical protein
VWTQAKNRQCKGLNTGGFHYTIANVENINTGSSSKVTASANTLLTVAIGISKPPVYSIYSDGSLKEPPILKLL